MRKGYVLAEILVGIIILAGVLVAVSEFLAGSLKATVKNQSASEALRRSYTVAQWITLKEDLSNLNWPSDISVVWSPDALQSKLWPRVSEDVEEDDLELELNKGAAEADELELAAYDVEAVLDGAAHDAPRRIFWPRKPGRRTS